MLNIGRPEVMFGGVPDSERIKGPETWMPSSARQKERVKGLPRHEAINMDRQTMHGKARYRLQSDASTASAIVVL